MLSQLNTMLEKNKKILKLISYQNEITASNIANVDTPNYKPQSIDFSDILKSIFINKSITLKKTSQKHFNIGEKNYINNLFNSKNTKLNNNKVNMNKERINFLNNSLKYQSEITFLNYKIKNLLYILKN